MSWKTNPAHPGDKHCSMTVIESWGNGNRTSIAMVNVVCLCGNTKAMKTKDYLSRRTCGCGVTEQSIERKNARLRTRSDRKEEIAARHCFRKTRTGAERRGYEWELSFEEFYGLSTSSCFYCGEPPAQQYRVGGNQKQPVGNRDTGGIAEFYRNGIDRMDNEKGYTLENSTSCCKRCNFMKNTSSLEDFYAQMEKILKFRDLQQIRQ